MPSLSYMEWAFSILRADRKLNWSILLFNRLPNQAACSSLIVFKNKIWTQEICEKSSGTYLSDFVFPVAASWAHQKKIWEWYKMQCRRQYLWRGISEITDFFPCSFCQCKWWWIQTNLWTMWVGGKVPAAFLPPEEGGFLSSQCMLSYFRCDKINIFLPTSTKPSFGFLYTGRKKNLIVFWSTTLIHCLRSLPQDGLNCAIIEI